MEILQSGLAVIAILVVAALAMGAVGMVFRAGVTAYVWTGIALTTLAVALQIAPSVYAGDRGMQKLAQANENTDSRQVDRLREKVRTDILARTDMFTRYPVATARVTNRIRRG